MVGMDLGEGCGGYATPYPNHSSVVHPVLRKIKDLPLLGEIFM